MRLKIRNAVTHYRHIRSTVLFLTMYMLQGSTGSRILVTPFQFPSHFMVMRGLTEGLVNDGHEVYFALSDLTETPKGLEEDGFKVLHFHTRNETKYLSSNFVIQLQLKLAMETDISNTRMISEFCGEECYDMDADRTFMDIVKNLNFDLVVVDTFPPSFCKYFIPMYLNVPFVTFSPSPQMETTRIPLLPSVVPYIFLGQTPKMTFPWRFLNTIVTIITNIPELTYILPNVYDYRLIDKYNAESSVRSWFDYARKSSLHIQIFGPTLDFPTPSLPHTLSIECLLCSKGQPLPHELEKVISDYPGTIILTFGSSLKVVPDSVALKFMKAFSRMKELVIWRYDGILPGDLSDNVRVMKWLPQNDLLAHHKTKLFITHAGNNGQYESVYHGVPMLAFPIFGDQFFNALRMVEHGYGLTCDLRDFTSEELEDKINTVLTNLSFKEKTSKASKMLQNQLIAPKEKANFWMRHILEFGADHLRTPGLEMPWYAYYMLDILLVFYVLTTVWLITFTSFCIYVYRKCLKKGQKVKSE